MDCASVHILKIHLDFISEHMIFFSVKLIKGFNFFEVNLGYELVELAYHCFHSRDYYDFLQLQRKKNNCQNSQSQI